MTDNHDPGLEALFAASRQDLEDEGFTTRVVHRARFLKYRWYAGLLVIGLVLLAGIQLLAPSLQEFALALAWGLTRSLVDLGDGWLAWLAAPVNTVGSLIIFCAKGLRMIQKRIRSAVR